jgi:hypothetical protein
MLGASVIHNIEQHDGKFELEGYVKSNRVLINVLL